MLEFRPITLKDKKWMDPILKSENSRSADYNFGNLYVWDRYYRMLVSRHEDRIILKVFSGDAPMYSYPIGSGDIKSAFEEMINIAESEGNALAVCGVEEEGRQIMEDLYPGRFVFELDEDECDYMYLAEKLSTFSGKALHGQKNHCNYFEKTYSWEFRELTRELIPECLDMLRCWTETNRDRLDRSITVEHDAAVRGFASFECLDLEGGVLFADGRIVGYSVGEMTNEDTFDVHFEKAVTEIKGAYPMVCREMTRLAMSKHEGLVYMNREDDMGLEALRNAKMNLKPEYILKKYIARSR